MTEQVTLTELLRLVIVAAALVLSGWAIVDDLWDLVHVRRYGEIDGPRWVTAMEHLLFNGTLLAGWLLYLVLVGIAVYLPDRPNASEHTLATAAGWLSLGYSVCVLVAQVHRRVGRSRLRSLPLDAWERMLAAMFDGLTHEQRVSVSSRLLAATSAGRELGHAAANLAQAPVALLDEIARDARETPERRAEAANALAMMEQLMGHVRGLHMKIKQQESGS